MTLGLGVFLASFTRLASLAALQQSGGIPWWVWVLIVIVVVLVALWFMRRPSDDAPPAPAAPRKLADLPTSPDKPALAKTEPMPDTPVMPRGPDVVKEPPVMPEPPPMAAAVAPPMPEAPAMPAMPEAPPMPAMPEAQPMAAAEPQTAPAPAPDDLTKIEGIGPAISSALRSGGIFTFAQLAETEATRVREIMQSSGIRGGDTTTWGDQARLAASGEWAKLKKLQDKLMGGRRK